MGKGLNGLDDDEYIDIIEEKIDDNSKEKEKEQEIKDEQWYDYGKNMSASELVEMYHNLYDPEEIRITKLMIAGFDPEKKLITFKRKIYDLFTNVIEDFITTESPTHIFNTGLTSKYYVNFYEMVLKNTIMGKDLILLQEINNS